MSWVGICICNDFRRTLLTYIDQPLFIVIYILINADLCNDSKNVDIQT